MHGDLYVAKPRADGQWLIEELPSGINTDYNDSDPLIAPDESFLIFHSNRPGGVGEHDLYVSFKTKNGWSAPQNLGSKINTDSWEMAPALTLDGKFLLFTWRTAMETKIHSEIRWVSINVLKPFKTRASVQATEKKGMKNKPVAANYRLRWKHYRPLTPGFH